MVALSMAPTRYIAEADEWIASNASLLNLRLVAMANLHPIMVADQFVHLLLGQLLVDPGKPPEFSQLPVFDIGSVFLGKKILIDPVTAASGKDDGPRSVLIQSLFEDSATQIVGVAQHYLPDCRTKLLVRNQRFSCDL